MLQDLELAVRALRRRPGFSIVVVLTLALGIGGSLAIYSVVDAVLLRPLPFADPQDLVEIWETVDREQVEERAFSFPDYLDLREQSRSFVSLAAFDREIYTLAGDGPTERIPGAIVTPSFFEVIGVQPILGTALESTSLEGTAPRSSAPERAVLSHSFWLRRFGGDPEVLGRSIQLDGGARTVVGVMPPGFVGLDTPSEIWTSMESVPQRFLEARSSRWHRVIGRLAPGVEAPSAALEVQTIFARLEQEHSSNAGYSADVGPLQDRIVGGFRRPLSLLLAAAALVLLVAAVNVANLLIVRATSRRRQTALVAAIGASPRQLARRTLAETLVLGLVAGLAALLFATWTIPVLLAWSPVELPGFVSVQLSWRVVATTLSISVLCGAALGLAAWATTDRHAVSELLQGGRSSVSQRRRTRSGLLVFEIALGLVVAVAAGLLLRSWQQAQAIDPGFQLRDRVAIQLSHPGFANESTGTIENAAQRGSQLRRDVRLAIQSLAGVEQAEITTDAPFGDGSSATVLSPEGREYSDELPWGGATRVYRHLIGPDYFATLGIPMLEGRGFTESDLAADNDGAVLSRDLVERLWPGESPVGRRFKIGRPVDPGAVAAGEQSEPRWMTVLGVVADVRHRNLIPDPMAPSDPDIYFPFGERGPVSFTIVAASSLDPALLMRTLETRLRTIDPGIALFGATTLYERALDQTARLRFSTRLMVLFGAIAIVLVALGVHGVLAYMVSERTAEIGLRMAIGAQQQQVVGQIVRQAFALASVGLIVGLAAALAATRALASQLVATSTADPLVLTVAVLLLLTVVLFASALPARRASRVDPLVALRNE